MLCVMQVLEQRDIQKPEYIRLPPPREKDKFTGLSRSTLAELTIPGPANDHKPPVKSLVIKKRGATRGIRLINFDSLVDHLRKLENAEQFPANG